MKTCKRGHEYVSVGTGCPGCKQFWREYYRRQYRENPKYRAQELARGKPLARKRYEKDIERSREKARKYQADKRRSDDAYKQRQLAATAAYMKRRLKEPEYLEYHRKLVRDRGRELRKDPVYLQRMRDEQRARRDADPARARERELARERKRAAKPESKQLRRQAYNRRRARLRDACSPGVTLEQWAQVCSLFTNEQNETVCAYCKRACAITIDHIVPLARGGRDEPGNVVPACKSCNCSKGSRLLSEWHKAPHKCLAGEKSKASSTPSTGRVRAANE